MKPFLLAALLLTAPLAVPATVYAATAAASLDMPTATPAAEGLSATRLDAMSAAIKAGQFQQITRARLAAGRRRGATPARPPRP